MSNDHWEIPNVKVQMSNDGIRNTSTDTFHEHE
jgi:hypothetical protein